MPSLVKDPILLGARDPRDRTVLAHFVVAKRRVPFGFNVLLLRDLTERPYRPLVHCTCVQAFGTLGPVRVSSSERLDFAEEPRNEGRVRLLCST
jgi:hypothetical protein